MKKQLLIVASLLLAGVFAAPAFAQSGEESLQDKSMDAATAGQLPLDKVCLQRSNLYSAGAIVTMNQKPHVCKMDKNMENGGALSWVEQQPES